MRARNLKPKLFKNEVLGRADPLLTILFEGLWCEADREGRLEDRPLRLCVEIFPYRRKITEKRMDAMLEWLHEHEFITRYAVGDSRFIQVLTFLRHQSPHSKEQPSIIPPLSASQHLPSPGRTPVEPEKGSGEHALTPDSGLRTPESPLHDSGLRTPDSRAPARERRSVEASAAELASAMKAPRSAGRLNGGKPEKNLEQLRQDVAKLAQAGMRTEDIAHALGQYGVTGEQVRDWLGKETEGHAA